MKENGNIRGQILHTNSHKALILLIYFSSPSWEAGHQPDYPSEGETPIIVESFDLMRWRAPETVPPMCTLQPENAARPLKALSGSASIVLNHLTQPFGGLRMNQAEQLTIRKTIRRHQLREIVPLADSTIYEMEQRGEFPRRFALSPRCIVWDLAEVQAWLETRRAAPVNRAKHPDVRLRKARPVKVPDQARATS